MPRGRLSRQPGPAASYRIAAAVNAAALPAGLAARLAGARHVVALTGAGISAESGVPTFRDAQTGLWSRFRPEDLATVEAFEADPDTVWSWYEWRRDLVGRAQPNAGHLALAGLERLLPRFTLVTQNVDGLHQRAGSCEPVEFHGNLFSNRCLACGRRADAIARPCPRPPRCACCGGLIRPGVVWFGEAIPAHALAASFAAVEDCDVFLSVGTAAQVYPAAGLVERAAAGGATLVEVNPQPSGLARLAEFVLAAPAGTVLPALYDAVARCLAAPARH